ncbi:hypothetical protein CBR_g57392 [Chara braunii]|uniref:Reverse transcriptase domain-containing protein n=1 Tax=Chara braunii TaxID=69332 RepID=A0A388ME55_CHABU|nr:hypothetical protein CBR_g57392 [Chara braunii]|eukprot:GBG92841.1 hypothetical protein CBR_g57392 [Chara braunii]
MKRRHRAYALNDEERGMLDVDKIPMIRIHTVPHKPWNMRRARYPNPDEERKVVDYLDDKIHTHVADYSSGPYASLWFCFIKPNGTLRWVQDLQRLNAVTVRDAGRLPNADALSESCAGRPIISLVDLYSGYDQFPVYPPDRPVTAMQPPRGLIHMNVAPQGWTNAVAMVQRAMIRVMQSVNPHIIQPYIDDFAMKGPTVKESDEVSPGVRRFVWEHIQDLEKVLSLLEEHNLTASGAKSRHCMREAFILGFICSEKGRRPDVKKTDKITEWPVPFHSITDVRSFLGNVDEVSESQDDEFEEGEIKEGFRAEEYDGIYLELGLLLSCEMRLRDASDRTQRMLQRYLDLEVNLSFEELLDIRARQIGAIEERIQEASDQVARSRMDDKARWDQSARVRKVSLAVGDVVLLYDSSLEKQWSRKLDKRWLGPYRIVRVRDFGAYQIEELNVTEWKDWVSGTRLKKFVAKEERDPEPREARPSRGGQKALARREEEPEQEPEVEEQGAYPERRLGPVEFHRFTEGGLRRSPAHTQKEPLVSEGPLRELETHLDISQWRASPQGEEHGEQVEEVPREEVQDTQRERGLGDVGRRAGKEAIEVGKDMPPQTPAVGLRLGDAPGSTRHAEERLQREEVPLPSSGKAPSPEDRTERRRERAAVRREALILIHRHLAAHALEHPDLEEPAPAEPRQKPYQPEKKMEAEIPKRVDLRTRERAPAGETAEEKRARRTRRIDEIWQERQRLEAAGELPEQQQERQRSEAAGALPGQPPSAPARAPQIPEMWRDFWEQRGEELPSPVRAGFGVAKKAEERLDRKIKFLAKTTFDRHLLLESDLAGKKMKEASHGVRLEAMEVEIQELMALVAS